VKQAPAAVVAGKITDISISRPSLLKARATTEIPQ
jgi:hypothetical protein